MLLWGNYFPYCKWLLDNILIVPFSMVCCVFAWCIWKIWRLGFKIGWLVIKHRVYTCSQHTIRILRNLYYANPYAFIGAEVFLTYEIGSHPWVIYQVTHFWELIVSSLPDSLSYYLSFNPIPSNSNVGLLAATSDSSTCLTSLNSDSIESIKRHSLIQDSFLNVQSNSCQISSGLTNSSSPIFPSIKGDLYLTSGKVKEIVFVKNYYGQYFWVEGEFHTFFLSFKKRGFVERSSDYRR
jgi:hypothetical protein